MKIKKRLLILLVIVFWGTIVAYGVNSVIDYRRQITSDINKPNAGMRIYIKHQDGTTEQLDSTGNAYPSGKATVGDTIEIRDISDISSFGTKIETWDFQYAKPSGEEVARCLGGKQYGKITELTLDEVGTYEFYLAVMDDAKTNDPKFKAWWQNWSDNGIHKSAKQLADGKEYWCYFVSIKIEVEEYIPPTEPDTIYLDAKIGGPSQVDKGETFVLKNTSTIGGILWSDFIKQNPSWRVGEVRYYYKKPYNSKVNLKSKSFEEIKVEIGSGSTTFLLQMTVYPPSDYSGEFKVLKPKNINLDDYIELK